MTISEFLTPKQKAFCDEYLIDRNAAAAALRAGYSKSIALNGYLMNIPKIKVYLQERIEHAAEKAQVNQDMVLRELYKIAFGNLRNYFLPDGGLKPVHELSEDEASALWHVTLGEEKGAASATAKTTKLRMYNKLTALDRIAKHLNFYKPEAKEPETVYVYMDKAELTKDDLYGEGGDGQETGGKQQEINGSNDTAQFEEEEDEIDEDEIAYQKRCLEPLPEGADENIRHGRDVKLSCKIELHQTYNENLWRLLRYERKLGEPIEEVWADADSDMKHPGLPLIEELDRRARKVGLGTHGDSTCSICSKFIMIRHLEEAYGISPVFDYQGNETAESTLIRSGVRNMF